MCGICGIFYKNEKENVSHSMLEGITRTMIHRGPDDEGYFIDANIGLGHRRLSIIDLSGGHQPMFNEDKSCVVILNGEIYNYQILTTELKQKGHIFKTKSDTEVIVHAYEEYGKECVKKLRGMYAFAIWDKAKKILMLARDRVGKKPLYYYDDNKIFLFASEIKALLKSEVVRRKVNRGYLDFYLSLGYVPGGQTLFSGINKLEPGHLMIINQGGLIHKEQYWDINEIKTINYTFRQAKEKLAALLTESINIRLMSEVPLGVFLSGGLDSSTIVALTSKMMSEPLKTFSVGYRDDTEANELDYADIIAREYKTDHHKFYLTSEDMFLSIDTLLNHTEEPIVESAGIALFKLAKLARPKATVLLSGEGGDELFAGYPIYPKMKILEALSKIMQNIPPKLRTLIGNLFTQEKQKKYIEWMGKDFKRRFLSLSNDLADDTKRMMYTDELKAASDNIMEEYFMRLHQRCQNKTLLGKMLYIDTKTWLPEDLLIKADKMTMAASVEMRAPFLDHHLLEFATSLPDNFKLKGTQGKFILKEYLKELIPRKIVYRRKKGFPVPLTFWFGGELYQRSKDLLLSGRALGRGYFQKGYIQGLFEKIRQKHDLGRRIFSLVVLELWHRKYID